MLSVGIGIFLYDVWCMDGVHNAHVSVFVSKRWKLSDIIIANDNGL